ncbi:DUF1045 domain-containing protein [Paracoccus stylophorae]|uniref:DUF1045 domain-containing protein n=1 Tax=Paracoccus stylophorae TaxID=659350 RepID=A0ABY7SZ24_9RHOB|nr:DUF1045 domain-containing protein [Paracoccus stylophorae]WCR11693.1 DUF1045 domain-containing protein [Paracoccus stylophorae]
MRDWRRFAIYYTATGPLAEFGATWLGWDIATGQPVPPPGRGKARPARIEALTRTPRRYGFHATLKPPFRLAQGCREPDLLASLRALAAGQPPVALPGGLVLAALDGFSALIPAAPCQDLQDLAARVVAGVDDFRAPLTPQDRARRNPDRLTPRQVQLLDEWGYPWVMDQFRFHMTLGGRLSPVAVEALIASLRPHLAPFLPDPQLIDALTLVGEDAEGRFHQIERAPLNG